MVSDGDVESNPGPAGLEGGRIEGALEATSAMCQGIGRLYGAVLVCLDAARARRFRSGRSAGDRSGHGGGRRVLGPPGG